MSEANAEAAHNDLVKEKAKVESLQHELKEQMIMFSLKFDQEHEIVEDLKTENRKILEDRKTEVDSFQKNVQNLQKCLQDKVNALKEKEESNSILRKEAMDLVARYDLYFLIYK